jgi:protein-S-isoprenylcysteine O-methyltransferase Ste14
MLRFLAHRRVPLGFVSAAAVLILAQPTKASWLAGALVALVGEAIRIWAAGHLEKGREVTRSGPYRWSPHPLYAGSSIVAVGVVMAARSPWAACVALLYMGATLTAAIRIEEAHLRQKFGADYERYRAGSPGPVKRRFSLARARRNREERAVAGLVVGFALLALKTRSFL